MTTTTRKTTVAATASRTTTGASEFTMGLASGMAGLTGIWGVACLVSALINSGGLVGMVNSYMAAIGM